MKILFFGSPQFAVPTLNKLAKADDISILRVFTQPDKPAGRGKKMTAPAVKIASEELGLPVEQPDRIRGRIFRNHCKELGADAFVVVAFGKIFPGKLLGIPRLGCINLHSSILPHYRGAAPINWAIVNGETRTGVSTMIMEEGLDSGPVLMTNELQIGSDEKTPELAARLADTGAELMLKTLRALAKGSIAAQEQDHSLVTLAPMISKEDGRIFWDNNSADIYNQFRGFYPWPGVYGEFRGDILKIKDMQPESSTSDSLEPGTLYIEGDRLLVACGTGAIELLSIQLPGKRALPARDFINGVRLSENERMTGFYK
jgi:methionyl-tRNA formyltransferase